MMLDITFCSNTDCDNRKDCKRIPPSDLEIIGNKPLSMQRFNQETCLDFKPKEK